MNRPSSKNQEPQVLPPVKKPALVLVHGFRGSPIGLDAIAQTLRQSGYEVYIPAIPPFGNSQKLATYTPASYADFLAKYVKRQKLDHPVLIGHSMGSLVVASALQKYPQLFAKKAVLMSPISKRTAAPFRLVAPLSGLAPRRMVDYVTTKFLFVPKKDKVLFHNTLVITHQCSQDHPPLRREVLRSASFSTHYAITDFYLRQDLLLLAGAQDRLISQQQTTTAAAKLQAQTLFLPHTGHLHNYEQPQETAQAIVEFLQNS